MKKDVMDLVQSRAANVAMVTKFQWWMDEINLKDNIQK
jgi:hypothetical protein